jgi:hypothetical protein
MVDAQFACLPGCCYYKNLTGNAAAVRSPSLPHHPPSTLYPPPAFTAQTLWPWFVW